MSGAEKAPLIGVLDAGTRTAEFVVFRAQSPEPLVSHGIDLTQISLQEGWLEEDPREMLDALDRCVREVAKRLPTFGYTLSDVRALGVTNQRETTVVWDRTTGAPLHNAICWSDTRTEPTVEKIVARLPDKDKNHLKHLCGMPISPYFSAVKLRWLRDNVPAVRRAVRAGTLLFGTVDSWIVWNITGGVDGGVHATDVTNASRTMLMNIETLNWDPVLLHTFGVREDALPEIRSCSEVYGRVRNWSVPELRGVVVSGVMGNQQSALVGQRCLAPGQAKNTYRSGCFLLYNTGAQRVHSSHGLVTTVAYRLGPRAPVAYALEGSVQVAGAALGWLRRNMGMVKEEESDVAPTAITNTGDVYFVPAFKGLYAPYWRTDARAILCGLTAYTTRAHVVRAALEAVCFQTRDVLEAMHKDCGISLSKLHVDGRLTANPLLMQLQADVIGIPVVRPHANAHDVTALGVAMAAGNAAGVDLWDLRADARAALAADAYLPTTTESERDVRYAKWKMAVQRSLGWAVGKRSRVMTDERYRQLASIPPALFLISSFVLMAFASKTDAL